MAVENSGMSLKHLDTEINKDKEEEQPNSAHTITIDTDAWSNNVINALPSVSMCVFEGKWYQTKTMTRTLSVLWEVPDDKKVIDFFGDECSSNNKKRKNDN
eukprot:6903909-Ditylum_brightwellii.AAC.1